jgi:hypothetical protein
MIDCYLERRRRSSQHSEWVPPEQGDVGCITDSIHSMVRSECGGTRWRTGGEVKGKPANGVGSQYSHTTSEGGVFGITNADAHTSAASSRLNWLPRRSKWTRPFRRKVKCGFCTCAIRFRTSSMRRVYCTQLMTNTWVSHKVTGRMLFSFVMQGVLFQRPGLLRAQKFWVIMRELFCYCTVSANTTLFPNHTSQILSDWPTH